MVKRLVCIETQDDELAPRLPLDSATLPLEESDVQAEANQETAYLIRTLTPAATRYITRRPVVGQDGAVDVWWSAITAVQCERGGGEAIMNVKMSLAP